MCTIPVLQKIMAVISLLNKLDVVKMKYIAQLSTSKLNKPILFISEESGIQSKENRLPEEYYKSLMLTFKLILEILNESSIDVNTIKKMRQCIDKLNELIDVPFYNKKSLDESIMETYDKFVINSKSAENEELKRVLVEFKNKAFK